MTDWDFVDHVCSVCGKKNRGTLSSYRHFANVHFRGEANEMRTLAEAYGS